MAHKVLGFRGIHSNSIKHISPPNKVPQECAKKRGLRLPSAQYYWASVLTIKSQNVASPKAGAGGSQFTLLYCLWAVFAKFVGQHRSLAAELFLLLLVRVLVCRKCLGVPFD